MSKLRNLLNYIRDNAISVDGKFIEIDIAPYEDELDQLQQAHRAAEESAKDAHRRGWEQCKRESMSNVWAKGSGSCNYCSDIADAIASMEYKELTND